MPIAGHSLEARTSTSLGIKNEPSVEPSVLAHEFRDQGIIGWPGVRCECGLGF